MEEFSNKPIGKSEIPPTSQETSPQKSEEPKLGEWIIVKKKYIPSMRHGGKHDSWVPWPEYWEIELERNGDRFSENTTKEEFDKFKEGDKLIRPTLQYEHEGYVKRVTKEIANLKDVFELEDYLEKLGKGLSKPFSAPQKEFPFELNDSHVLISKIRHGYENEINSLPEIYGFRAKVKELRDKQKRESIMGRLRSFFSKKNDSE